MIYICWEHGCNYTQNQLSTFKISTRHITGTILLAKVKVAVSTDALESLHCFVTEVCFLEVCAIWHPVCNSRSDILHTICQFLVKEQTNY